MDKDLAEQMLSLCTEEYGNPNSIHSMGIKANKMLEEARLRVARILMADPREIFFTSSATESINWVLRSCISFRGKRKKVVTSAIEHKAVLNTLKDLKNTHEIDVVEIKPGRDGIIDSGKMLEMVDEETFLVSLMAVNNVTGSIQPFEEVGKALRSRGVLYHVDAVQAIGKCPFTPAEAFCDFASFSAHKFHGPKGVGITYVKRGAPIRAVVTGGGQEKALRSGTQNVPGIVVSSIAMERAVDSMEAITAKLKGLKERLKLEVERIGGVVNTAERSVANTLNVSFPGVKSEVLANALSNDGVYVGISSACSSRNDSGQYVLDNMGLEAAIASSSLRISMSKFTTVEELEILVERLKKSVSLLKF
jgi:cysteine desulfurase